jgi:hypothetical protein
LLDDWVEQLEHEGSMPRRMIVANVVIQHAPCAEKANAYEKYNKTHTPSRSNLQIFFFLVIYYITEKK